MLNRHVWDKASRLGDRGKSDMSRLGITNYFVNTIITALQASEWEVLLQRFEGPVHFISVSDLFFFWLGLASMLCSIS